MGLRINTNIASLVSLHTLRQTDLRIQTNLERLSTGERINRSADDPAGLSLSESMRAQIRALRQTTTNARSASNLLNTADAALGEVSRLLNDLRRSLTFALDGSATPDQIAAEQQFVDNGLNSIRRISQSTRFGDISLLDGSAGFQVSGVSQAGILEVKAFSVRLNPVVDPTPFQIRVTQAATQASGIAGASALSTSIAASGGPVTIRITGSVGSVDIPLASGATSAAVQQAVNDARGITGIYASGGYLYTETFGSEAFLRIEQVGGTGVFRGGNPAAPGLSGVGGVFLDRGVNAVVSLNNVTVSGAGNTINLNTGFFTGQIELNPIANQDPLRGAGSTGTFNFSIRRSGLTFQFGTTTSAVNQPTLGIPSVAPENLGSVAVTIGGKTSGGALSTLYTGAGNDLFANAQNGLGILLQALDDVGQARTVIGGFVADVVDPTEWSQEVAQENLRAADSDLRDVDFASETADFTRNQVLLQAGISVLAQANALPQNVLQLLK